MELSIRNNVNKISAVIPAYNEEKRIEDVIKKTQNFVDEIIVVNDCSSDRTGELAIKTGVKVISNQRKLGYIESIKRAFREAGGNIVITLDADGEHNPAEIPILLKPILNGEADLTLGKRKKIPRISERFFNWLTYFKVKIKDSGTGFRAIRKELAIKLNLKGKCTCGIFALEACSHGGRIVEVPITINSVDKKRKIVWHHLWQFFYILSWMILK